VLNFHLKIIPKVPIVYLIHTAIAGQPTLYGGQSETNDLQSQALFIGFSPDLCAGASFRR
jgi:hypothetical protein